MQLSYVQVLIVFVIIGCFSLPVEMIGCFVCSSINNSTHNCEDTFNVTTPDFYIRNCKAARKGRNGLFPATDCIKMVAKGYNHVLERHENIVVRDCVVDNGDINSDTEIGRSNHCGLVNWLKFDRGTQKEKDGKLVNVFDTYKGCVVSCKTDGCNSSPRLAAFHDLIMQAIAAISFTLTLLLHRR